MILKVFTSEPPTKTHIFGGLRDINYFGVYAREMPEFWQQVNAERLYDLTGDRLNHPKDEVADEKFNVVHLEREGDLNEWVVCTPGFAYLMNDQGKTVDRF